MTLDRSTVVGVVGAGAMGTGIAQVAATYGHTVRVFDTDGAACERARLSLRRILDRLTEKGRIETADADSIFDRIEFVKRLEELSDCGVVIEAIVENLDVKKALFSSLDAIVSNDGILATNTSSLSIAAISSACPRADRVLGIHFFNPAPLMPLVEIVPGVKTVDDTVTRARGLVDAWGKTTVLAKDTPGFIVNRVARPFYGEALRILEEGIAGVATIDWAMKELGGFRMGPFELMDFIGHDVNYAVTETVFEAFFYDPRYKPSFTQKRLLEAGLLGRKTGRGFYEYGGDTADPEPDTDIIPGRGIVSRILSMLINEAADASFWNIATREDIDLAMVKGVAYPKGLLRWADELGAQAVLETLTGLQAEYGEDRYRPSPLLRRMARDGGTFFPKK